MTAFAPSRDEEARALVAIVDDDASVRQSMGRLVRSLGYRTQVFGAADEFLASAALRHALDDAFRAARSARGDRDGE